MKFNHLIFAVLFLPIISHADYAFAQKKNPQRVGSKAPNAPVAPARKTSARGGESATAQEAPQQAVSAGPAAPAPRYVDGAKPNKKEAPVPQSNSAINDLNCDFHYQRCMGRICTDPKVGKCVCYEDSGINNQSGALAFADIDGQKIRRGFELLSFAKRKCEEIVDQCMEVRRGIITKYETGIQRDCLKLSELESKKDKTLQGEYKELAACAQAICTASGGAENFSRPEFGLCFDRNYANFVLDMRCPEKLAASKTPAALRQFFLSHMDARRGLACRAMQGQLSPDGEKCMITVDYGSNKESIKMSRQFAVGDMVVCSGKGFSVVNQLTKDYILKQRQDKIMMAAMGVRIGSAVVGTAVSFGGAGALNAVGSGASSAASAATMATATTVANVGSQAMTVASVGITIAEKGVEMKHTVDMVKEGDMTEEKGKMALVQHGAAMAMSAISLGGSISGLSSAASGAATAAGAASTASKVATGLSLAGQAISFGAEVVDSAEQKKIDEYESQMEREGERRGREGGSVQTLSTERGNCFTGGEWIATENEAFMLMWRL